MQLLDSHIEAGQELSAKDRQAYYTALIEYLYYGKEPNLKGPAKAVFVAIRPTLDNSKARAEAGSRGGSRKQKQPKREAKPESNSEANTEANAKQTGKQTRSKTGSYQDSSSPSYSSSYSPSVGEGSGEGEIPTPEAVTAYFQANLLRGNPDEFYDHYASQGWVKGNGMAVCDWRAQARKWSRDQVKRDAERAARGEPEPEQAVWKPAQVDLDKAAEDARRDYEEKVARLSPEERERFGLD